MSDQFTFRYYDVLKFKSPKRIDWPATEAALFELVKKEPGTPVEKSLLMSSSLEDLKNRVRRSGVNNLYQTKMLYLKYEAEQETIKK